MNLCKEIDILTIQIRYDKRNPKIVLLTFDLVLQIKNIKKKIKRLKLVAYWKCNFPMNPHVHLFVGRSVGWSFGLLHFHVPIGALLNSNFKTSACWNRVVRRCFHVLDRALQLVQELGHLCESQYKNQY